VDFLLDADSLAPVIKVLQDALTRRPNPEGEPNFDLHDCRMAHLKRRFVMSPKTAARSDLTPFGFEDE
jgi:hypothetical protein